MRVTIINPVHVEGAPQFDDADFAVLTPAGLTDMLKQDGLEITPDLAESTDRMLDACEDIERGDEAKSN